jgi:hypothetical protein
MKWDLRSRTSSYAVGLGTALSAVVVLSCARSTEPSHLANLSGVWAWVASVDVRTQQRHTPVSEGFTARLQFVPETQRAGTFVYSRDGALAVQDSYGIAFEDAPGNDFIRLNASVDYLREFAWISVGTDTLRLGGVMEMGFNSVYARIRN